MAELRWFVLRAVSGQEKKVKAYLEAEAVEMGVVEFMPQVLIPMEKVIEMKKGVKTTREKTHIPGYIFINADLENAGVMHVITGAPSFIGFLGIDRKMIGKQKPNPLPDSEVKRLLGQTDDLSTADARLQVSFLTGESVKVIDGPFNGFVGNVQTVHEDQKKLDVNVVIFGRNTPVSLSFTQVEKQL